MNTKKEMKTLRAEAQAALDGKIGSKAKLYAALPTLIALQNALAAARKSLQATAEIARKLSDACTAFAEERQTLFEEGHLVENQNGVRVGDIVIDDVAYHLACGFDGYMRTAGDKMTQEFLRTLPEGWVKTTSEISTTGINAAAPTDENLKARGLKAKPKNVWSVAP